MTLSYDVHFYTEYFWGIMLLFVFGVHNTFDFSLSVKLKQTTKSSMLPSSAVPQNRA